MAIGRFGALLLILLAGAALPATPASAATARASGALTMYAGPGYAYAPVGRLPRNAVVHLAECTPSGRWCRIVNGGWVLGSYLVGSAAKVEATPWQPLVNPFHRMFPHRPRY
jgi:uncharacterized protein YraI